MSFYGYRLSKVKFNIVLTSGPIGEWEVKLEILTDRPTDRRTNWLTGGHECSEGSFTFNKSIFNH